MTFPFTVFKNKNAIGDSYGVAQTTPYATFTTWEEYCQIVAEAQDLSLPRLQKNDNPVILHGTSLNNWRSAKSLLTSSAVWVDCDRTTDLKPLRAFLDSFPYAYMYQLRWAGTYWKYHLIIPFDEPIQNRTSLPAERRAFTEWLHSITGHPYDTMMYPPAALLYYYAPRPNDPNLPETEVSEPGAPFLSWGDWLADHDVVPSDDLRTSAKRRTVLTPVESDNPYLKAFARFEPEWLEHKGGYEITCPHGHHNENARKTLLYVTQDPYVKCLSSECAGQPMSYFVEALDEDEQAHIHRVEAEGLKAKFATITTVSVPEAQSQIRAALEATRPVARNATVIRVTTGGGKSTAALDYLRNYCSPLSDEVAGKTAILATPTNALADELADKYPLPHRRRRGLLSVLNQDGSPACKKYTAAKTLQAAGGDVNRLMCPKCEYREACPAKEGRETGEGSLTITNHALMASTAQALHEKGRHPLLIWDESPPMVLTAAVPVRDMNWLLLRFDAEARPKGPLVERMVSLRAFPDKYRVALRPLLSVLRTIGPGAVEAVDPETVAEVWVKTPANRAVLDRALTISNTAPAETAWASIRAAIDASGANSAPEIPFDLLRPDQAKEVLRIEGLLSTLRTSLLPGAKLYPTSTDLHITAPSGDAVLFQNHGGVILDATANVSELKALRPDLKVIDIPVQDSGTTHRTIHRRTDLTRINLKHHPGALTEALATLPLAQIRSALGREPRVVCFTYKAHVPTNTPYEWGYFGNVRGYDRFFQEGYDVFVTLGDPVTNLTALKLKWSVLTGTLPDEDSEAWKAFVEDSGRSETAQAHGRARSPQSKLSDGPRWHFHFGKSPPLGWGSEALVL